VVITSFKKPKTSELKMFFKTHPVQPFNNVTFNPLLAYYCRVTDNNRYKREWLTYDYNTKFFYCTFCLAFSKNSNRFTIGCQIDPRHLYQRLYEHEKSVDHTQCIDSYLLNSKQKDLYNLFTKEKQAEKCKKRAVLDRIIETIKMIGKRGLSYRGAKNAEAAYTLDDGTIDHGNFLEVLILISKFDLLLKDHIDNAVLKSSKYHFNNKATGKKTLGRPGSLVTLLSKTTADYIIEAIGQLMRKCISDDINEAQFFSIQIDSTQDINVHDQLSVIIRYVNTNVNERLLGFVRCISGTGENLCKLVCELLKKSGLDLKKCVGSSTDGAANMRGEYNGFTAWLKKEVPEQLHVWCHAHILNLVMTDVTKICIECVSFFGLLNSIAVFVRESYLRMHKWETTSKYKFISVIGETRWWAKDRCVSKIFGSFHNPKEALFVDIVQALDEIYNTPNFTSDVRFKAKVYIDSLLKFETIILSQIFLQIFSSTTPLSLYLKTKGLDIFQVIKMVKQTMHTLNEQSRDFENILEASNTFTEWANITFNDRHLGLNIPREFAEHRISRKKIMAGEISKDDPTINQVNKYRINVFNVIYDQIINGIQHRFSEHEIFSSISILDPSNFVSTLNLSHIDIAKKLTRLTSILNKFEPSLTVGTFTDEIKDFASKWPKIKELVDDDDQEKLLQYDDNNEDNEEKADENKNKCKYCIICCFKVLQIYNLHSMAYSSLFLAYKFIITLSCTQVRCETAFSKLKYILNRLRNCLLQEKMDTFLQMNIENHILQNIKNEDVIELLANKSSLLKNILI